MALTYTTLQALILNLSHRADLTSYTADYVRLCEGMIRREVHALEVRTTLEEADRSSEGVYNLADTIQTVRGVYGTSSTDNEYRLENVGMAGIRSIAADADVLYYAVSGKTIEFRGVPATDASLPIIAVGWPAALDVAATNDLLTDHEALYVYGSLFHLYQHSQDNELAQNALSVFNDAVEKLNRQTDSKRGGGSVQPAYNLGHNDTSVRY